MSAEAWISECYHCGEKAEHPTTTAAHVWAADHNRECGGLAIAHIRREGEQP